jgi:hypothetical protein
MGDGCGERTYCIGVCCGAKGQPFAPLNRSYLNRHSVAIASAI